MFERYTERARRVVFYARYEASEFGSRIIETEHLLLGLLREDKELLERHAGVSAEEVRRKVEARIHAREKISTSVDLPVSNEGKRILAYAGEEADRLEHYVIDIDHLLLGILRESTSLAAVVLAEMGVHLEALRESVAKSPRPDRPPGNEQADKPYEEPWGKIRALMSKLVSMQERPDAPAADATEQRSTSSRRNDDGTLVAETVQIFGGHRILIKERFQLTDDGKTLVLSIEVAGPRPGQRQEHTIKFDVPLNS